MEKGLKLIPPIIPPFLIILIMRIEKEKKILFGGPGLQCYLKELYPLASQALYPLEN